MFDPLSKVVSPVWACKWKPAFLMDQTIRHLFFHFIQSSGVYINYITAWFIYLQRISLEAEAEKITVFAGCVCSRMNRTNVNNVWIVIVNRSVISERIVFRVSKNGSSLQLVPRNTNSTCKPFDFDWSWPVHVAASARFPHSPITSLCIQFLDEENDGKNNKLHLGWGPAFE